MSDLKPVSEISWPTCGSPECPGVQLGREGACLAHADQQARKGFLATLRPGSDLDLRGTSLDQSLLSELLTALRGREAAPVLGYAKFDGAQFSAGASFEGVQFSKDACFDGAKFNGPTSFEVAQFNGDTVFDGAHFNGHVRFHWALWNGAAGFVGTGFNGSAEFDGTQFSRSVCFDDARFSGDVRFDWALFADTVGFKGTQFSGLAEFRKTRFNERALFAEAQFKRAGVFGPAFSLSTLVFDYATFEQDTVIEVVAAALSCVGARFAEAATLRLRYARVVLDGAVFVKPATITFNSDPYKHRSGLEGTVASFDEDRLAQVLGAPSPQPRLMSLRRVDVATLTLSELDLAACLFQGAHHLDQLRVEGARPFADTPAAWRLRLGHRQLSIWRRWSRRQTLAEEHHWRNKYPFLSIPGRWSWLVRPPWHGPACQIPKWVAEQTGQRVQPLTPNRLAVLYRALRKAQEDNKNEPGAADFYYGEMEMRRYDRRTPWSERVILWLYWLIAGYGLRGLRSLACLVAVILGLGALLKFIGFNGHDPGFGDAFIYSAQSTISITSGNKALTENVSWAGEVLRIVLRLAGPTLLGLTLLSIRNRVKR